ncbi:MAG: hypothetical protein AAF467_20275 [Actinomycetota bacterium]
MVKRPTAVFLILVMGVTSLFYASPAEAADTSRIMCAGNTAQVTGRYWRSTRTHAIDSVKVNASARNAGRGNNSIWVWTWTPQTGMRKILEAHNARFPYLQNFYQSWGLRSSQVYDGGNLWIWVRQKADEPGRDSTCNSGWIRTKFRVMD